MFLSLQNLEFRYEPFPIGLAKPVMEDLMYREFVENFPPIDIFESYKALSKLGNKFVLSEKENKKAYHDFVRGNPLWREFYRWIKSDQFTYGIIDTLREHHIDLGYCYISPTRRFVKRMKDLMRRRKGSQLPRLRARFEFSALPVDGGYLKPHTDAPTKVVTLIISILHESEWNSAFGGGTDVNWPKDIRYKYNQLNRLADFEDVEVVHTYEFTPNQAIIFVKTYNSWHSVQPLTGSGTKALRKTVTINIES